MLDRAARRRKLVPSMRMPSSRAISDVPALFLLVMSARQWTCPVSVDSLSFSFLTSSSSKLSHRRSLLPKAVEALAFVNHR